MKSLSTYIVLCFLALAASCAPTKTVYREVTFDYDVNVDFARLKTYEWVSMPGTLRIDQFDRIRIQDIANTVLDERGMTVASHNPDIFIVMYGGQYKEADMTVMMDYEVFVVGRLKLAFYDAKSNEEIWWGETRANLFHYMNPEEKNQVVKVAVTRILEHYPPKP